MSEFLEVTSFDPLIVTALPGPTGPTGPAGAAGPTGPAGPTSGGTVTSVTAGDATVTVGGTATDPTVKVTPGTFDVSGAAATAQSVSLQKSSNLSDVASASTSRTNLGLGTAATQNKVAAGSAGVLDATDATTTNSRAPSGSAGGDLAGTFPNPTLAVDRITKALLTTKGDVIAATAASTPARVAVGSDGKVLTADAASAAGVKWAAAPSGYDQMPYVGLGGNSYESFSRMFGRSGEAAAQVTGTLWLTAVVLPAGFTFGNLSFCTGSSGLSTPTHWWFGVWDSAFAQLAVTADQTSAAWGTNAIKTLAIATTAAGAASTFTTTYAGLHYVGCLTVAGTVGNRIAAGGGLAQLSGASPCLSGVSTSSLTTPPAFPSTATAMNAASATGSTLWCSVSP